MTYRAVPRHLPFRVAGDAEAHAVHVVHSEYLGHPLDLAVAGAARVRAHGLDMTLMGKMGVAWQIVDANPFDGLLLIPGLPQLFDLGLVRTVPTADHQMAAHAGLHRRNAGLR